jgi:hypothetical protein
MTANVGSQQMWIQQPIESLSAIRLAGRTIAVAADVSASTSTGMTINVYSSTTVDNTAAGSWGSAITPTSGGSGTAVSGSFTRISGTYAIPSTAKSVMVQIITTGNVANGVVVYIGNAQAEIGSVPTAFTLAGGTLQGEYAAACRYYQRFTNTSSNALYAHSGINLSSTRSFHYVALQAAMRTSPSVAEVGAQVGDTVGSNLDITAISVYTVANNSISLDCTHASGYSASAPLFLVLPQNAYFELSAEL